MNELYQFSFDKEKKLLYWEWLKQTRKSSWEEMQEALLTYLNAIKENLPEKIIINEQNLNFIWIPDYQKWVDDHISAEALKYATKKTAFVKSEDVFQAVSVEQLVTEEATSKLNFKMFDNLADAQKWVKQ